MSADTPTLLCSAADLQVGAFADLARAFEEPALTAFLQEATRACETETSRRLVPFTITESHRAEGIDPDELGPISLGGSVDLQTAMGLSKANAFGAAIGGLVRRVWLREAPLDRYPDMWTYSGVTVRVTPSIGGTQTITPTVGPTEQGLIVFPVGTWCPIGTLVRVTYTGGYTTIPADLRRAAKWMAAAIMVRELDPAVGSSGHDPGSLEAQAIAWLGPYMRG